MEQEFGTWQPDGALPRVDYSLAVMEELRVYAEEGFQKIPHGGIEVGAVLLGERAPHCIRVLEWRPMACDHARGPGFRLSDKDREALGSQLERCGSAEELRGLSVVGWCHTHTRSKIFLSAEDLTIHEQFFTEPWQIALVLHPQKDLPPTAGFFIRDAQGAMPTESSPLEFTITPDPAQSLRPRRPSALVPVDPSRPASGRPDALTSTPRSGSSSRHERPMFRSGSTSSANFPPLPAATAPTEAPAPAPVSLDAPPVPVAGPSATPVAAEQQPVVPFAGGFPRQALWAAAALLAITALGTITYLWRLDRSGRTASLRVAETGANSLIISWDHTSPWISASDRGQLRITDGGAEQTVPLSAAVVRSGSVTYLRKADDVGIRLMLYRGEKLAGQESARYVGATSQSRGGESALDQRSRQLKAEVERLGEVLKEESTRTQRLREELALLEQRPAARAAPPRPTGRR